MMSSISKLARGAAKGCATLLALGLLLSCGGGTEQITPFAPTRMLVLGDEMSVLTDTLPLGRKYSTNALNADNTALDCVARPLWHQLVAYTYAFTYAECDPNLLGGNAAKVYAVPGAKVDDLPAQLERARLASSSDWSNTDLFMVLVGANDVLDVYQNVYLANPSSDSYDAALAALKLRGVLLARFINTLTRGEVSGPKVIVSTIPLMDLTPFGIKQAALYPELNVPSVLREFSNTFNTAMRAGDRRNDYEGIINDGRFIGLVELDGILQAGVNDPAAYGLNNITQAVCAVELPECTVSGTDPTQGTLVPNGNANTWLWASELWIGSTAQYRLGQFAQGRALGNPF